MSEQMHRWVEPHGDLTACGIRWWNGTRGEAPVTCAACQTAAEAALARIRALVDMWDETPDYTPSHYDQGRVDQRHDMTTQVLEALAGPSPTDEGGEGALDRVHNHAPWRPMCNERVTPDGLRGACLNDDGTSVTPPEADPS